MFEGFIGQFFIGPVAHRPAYVFGVLAGQGNDLGDLFGGEGKWSPGTGDVR